MRLPAVGVHTILYTIGCLGCVTSMMKEVSRGRREAGFGAPPPARHAVASPPLFTLTAQAHIGTPCCAPASLLPRSRHEKACRYYKEVCRQPLHTSQETIPSHKERAASTEAQSATRKNSPSQWSILAYRTSPASKATRNRVGCSPVPRGFQPRKQGGAPAVHGAQHAGRDQHPLAHAKLQRQLK